MGVREAICVPMQGRYDVVGVIYIDTSTSPQQLIQQGGANKFTEDHLKLMIAIAHQAALAVEDTRYYSAMVQAERLAAVGPDHRHALAPHQEHPAGHPRRQLPDRDGPDASTTKTWSRKGWKIVEKNQNKISALVMDMLTFSKEREPDLVPGEPQRGGRRRDRADAVAGRRTAGRAASGSPAEAMPDAGLRSRGHSPRGAERRDQRHRRLRRQARRAR